MQTQGVQISAYYEVHILHIHRNHLDYCNAYDADQSSQQQIQQHERLHNSDSKKMTD